MNVTFETESGSIYEIQGNKLCQSKAGDNYQISGRGRGTIGNWKEFNHISTPEVGKRMVISWGNTMTITSPIRRIIKND